MREENLVKTQQGDNHTFTEIISSHCVLLTTAQGDQILTLPINSSTTRLLLWVQLLCDWHRKFQFWYFQQQRIGIWFFDGYPCIVFLWVFLFLRNLSDWQSMKEWNLSWSKEIIVWLIIHIERSYISNVHLKQHRKLRRSIKYKLGRSKYL